jgi:hypothetical protein
MISVWIFIRSFAPKERRCDPGPVDDTCDWLFFGISRYQGA